MIKESLFLTLSAMKPVSLEFKDYLSKKLIILEFTAGAQLPQIPEVSQIIYFIATGVVSGSKILNRKKHTYRYAGSGKFIIPPFNIQTTAYVESVDFLSPTTLIGLDITSAREAMTLFEEAKPIFTQILGEERREFAERDLFLRLTFQERFDQFYANKPLSYGNSNVKNLASYFNTSVRNFERVKNGK